MSNGETKFWRSPSHQLILVVQLLRSSIWISKPHCVQKVLKTLGLSASFHRPGQPIGFRNAVANGFNNTALHHRKQRGGQIVARIVLMKMLSGSANLVPHPVKLSGDVAPVLNPLTILSVSDNGAVS